MQIQVEVISVEVIDKGKYKVVEVTCKQDGKTATKKVMSFGAQADTFKIFSRDSVKKGDYFNVEIEKNADGYWDWTKARPTDTINPTTDTATSPGKSNAAPARGNYETPDERAARQEFIVRQSSIANAIAYLNHNKKNYDPIEILDLAESFVMYVFKRANFGTATTKIDVDADVPV